MAGQDLDRNGSLPFGFPEGLQTHCALEFSQRELSRDVKMWDRSAGRALNRNSCAPDSVGFWLLLITAEWGRNTCRVTTYIIFPLTPAHSISFPGDAGPVQYQGEGSSLPQHPQPLPPALQTPSATGLQAGIPTSVTTPPSSSASHITVLGLRFPRSNSPPFAYLEST